MQVKKCVCRETETQKNCLQQELHIKKCLDENIFQTKTLGYWKDMFW